MVRERERGGKEIERWLCAILVCYTERQRELEVDEEERGETGEGERGSNQVSDLCCDTPDDDG